MVSSLSITFMVISGMMALGVPVAVLVYFYKKFRVSWKPILIGVLIFFVFSQVLEKLMHVYVLTINPQTMEWMKNPYAYAAYGGLAAGVFEEIGRFFGFRFMLQKYREWKDGIAYGIGHGGMEALLIGALAVIQSIVSAFLINSGAFYQMITAAGGGHATTALQTVKHQLLNTSPYTYLLSGLERVFAFALQLALSLLVLYGVRNRRIVFLVLAILVHAEVDFLAFLAGEFKINVFITEGFLFVVAILAVIFIVKAKGMFTEGETD